MINELLQHTLAASRQLVTLDDATINRILIDTASALLTRQAEVLAANVEDLSRMDPANPKYDRLKLTEERLAGIAGDMKNVASLPSPLGKLLSETTRPNGMVIRKMTVPFGVIGVIYEARPNVTFDVFSLCFKSGNACVLKGGSDADSSNRALVAIIHDVLTRQGVDPAAVSYTHLDVYKRQTIRRCTVAEFECFFIFIIIIHIDRDNRTEDLLHHTLEHRVRSPDDSRFNKVTYGLISISTENDFRIRRLFCIIDIAHDIVERSFIDNRIDKIREILDISHFDFFQHIADIVDVYKRQG